MRANRRFIKGNVELSEHMDAAYIILGKPWGRFGF
jgi:hypothetical protein